VDCVADMPFCTAYVLLTQKADIHVPVRAALIIDKNPRLSPKPDGRLVSPEITVQHRRPRQSGRQSVTERPIAHGTRLRSRLISVRECFMPQPYQPSPTLSPLSGYIAPIACQYCGAEAHLVNLSPHAELNAELRTFECGDCGRQTELIVIA
jgi:hypothetical protein